MPATHWLVPLLSLGLTTPLSASGSLDELARAYVAARTSGVPAATARALPSYARQTGLACSAFAYSSTASFGHRRPAKARARSTRARTSSGGGKSPIARRASPHVS